MTAGSPRLNLSSLPGPETIARRTFPNGAVGLAYENYTSPSVVIHGWIRAGSVDVPPEKSGLASLTSSMLTRGTERRSFAEIGEEIESLGAALSISAGGHTTRFTAKCLAEDLAAVLDVLTDCLYHPLFPSEYLEKRRGEVLTALQQRESNTRAMASLRFGELMYPDHPYGRSRLGYRQTVEGLIRADVAGFYKRCYGAMDMAAVIVGAIPKERGLDVLQEAMGGWRGANHTQTALPPVAPITDVQVARTEIPGKAQSDLVLGWVGVERKDPDFIKAYVADCILGQFGMMGRIGSQVRDRLGLAYYAYTSLDAGFGPGPWAVIAGVAPENVDRAIEAILSEARRLREETVDAQELADSKAYIIGSMPLRLEGKEELAGQIANMELYQFGLDHLQRLPAMIDALSAQDVLEVAQKLINPAAYVLSVAGP
jgi:zinc protease